MQKHGSCLLIDGEKFGKEKAKQSLNSWKRDRTISRLNNTLAGVHDGPSQNDTASNAALEANRLRFFERQHAETYERAIAALLSRIRSTWSGMAVLHALERTPKMTTIEPLLPKDGDWMDGSVRADNFQDAAREGLLLRDNRGRIFEPRRRGTGRGSSTTLRFITADLALSLRVAQPIAIRSNYVKPDPKTLAQEDEIMVHELVHSLRSEAGFLDNRRVPDQLLYGTFGEFFAFVVANIFRSEMGRKGIRNDNHGGFEMDSDTTSRDFIRTEKNRRHLRQFRRDHPQLFSELKAVDAEFNPLRRMVLT